MNNEPYALLVGEVLAWFWEQMWRSHGEPGGHSDCTSLGRGSHCTTVWGMWHYNKC